ncbi:MAG: hypothetical protein COX48_05905 [bacterium (Candidatus Stahlbacteria) CG23_combo_of_CG06-09_8_20_14_all_34_7]|nr:MAG: hypothetical protein COX48_05905 [bacterium (Candidatus Stahlbacteria) CG23_combo_of_CG06-09_8_20_14_all_34_7]
MNKKEEIELLKIPDLFLRSKLILKGYFSGIHFVPYKGASAEFSQYREYVVGDDFNRIDWKAYLRSGKIYVKESDNETNTEMVLLLDSSNSMNFGGKFRYAQTLAFLFIYICSKQNDLFTYAIFSDFLHILKRSGTGKRAIYDAARDISSRIAKGKTDIRPSLEKVFEKTKESSFVILISDLGDDYEKIIDALSGMRVKKNDIIIFHLASKKEESKEILDKNALRDMETKNIIFGGNYRERLKIIKERNGEIRNSSLSKGLDYNFIYIEDGFNEPLSKFFKRRMK